MIRILKMSELPRDEIFARNMPTMNVSGKVADIIQNVQEKGDAAVLAYTEKYDGAKLDSLLVTEEETKEILITYLQRKDRNLNRFLKYAELMKCERIMRQYLEVLV